MLDWPRSVAPPVPGALRRQPSPPKSLSQNTTTESLSALCLPCLPGQWLDNLEFVESSAKALVQHGALKVRTGADATTSGSTLNLYSRVLPWESGKRGENWYRYLGGFLGVAPKSTSRPDFLQHGAGVVVQWAFNREILYLLEPKAQHLFVPSSC